MKVPIPKRILKLEDLKENEIYRCRLSGANVLVLSVETQKYEHPSLAGRSYTTIACMAYHNGSYDPYVSVFDNQLEEL